MPPVIMQTSSRASSSPRTPARPIGYRLGGVVLRVPGGHRGGPAAGQDRYQPGGCAAGPRSPTRGWPTSATSKPCPPEEVGAALRAVFRQQANVHVHVIIGQEMDRVQDTVQELSKDGRQEMNQTCDRCGPAVRASYRVERTAEIFLCGHCASRHWPALSAQGWVIWPTGVHALAPQASAAVASAVRRRGRFPRPASPWSRAGTSTRRRWRQSPGQQSRP